MTDSEFSSWLRSMPRTLSQEDVDQRVAQHDAERGPYVPHGQEVHHIPGEARH